MNNIYMSNGTSKVDEDSMCNSGLSHHGNSAWSILNVKLEKL